VPSDWRVRSDVLNLEEDLGVTELKRLKMLEDENARLKRIVADLTLDKQILQEVVRKKL
jgi:putative transposase